MTERDTHFAGFARLGTETICSYLYFASIDQGIIEIVRPHIQTFLTQWAYDLVHHTIRAYEAPGGELTTHFLMRAIERIPDLTQLPESPEPE